VTAAAAEASIMAAANASFVAAAEASLVVMGNCRLKKKKIISLDSFGQNLIRRHRLRISLAE